MIKNIKKKKGFTLIELIIVIAIIGILAAIAVPKFGSIQKDAKIKADIATAKTISNAVSVLVAEGKIAETVTVVQITDAAVAVAAPATTEATAAKEIGTYLQSVPKSGLYKGNNFWVTVTNGNAVVSVSQAVPGTATVIQVYPVGVSPYN